MVGPEFDHPFLELSLRKRGAIQRRIAECVGDFATVEGSQLSGGHAACGQSHRQSTVKRRIVDLFGMQMIVEIGGVAETPRKRDFLGRHPHRDATHEAEQWILPVDGRILPRTGWRRWFKGTTASFGLLRVNGPCGGECRGGTCTDRKEAATTRHGDDRVRNWFRVLIHGVRIEIRSHPCTCSRGWLSRAGRVGGGAMRNSCKSTAIDSTPHGRVSLESRSVNVKMSPTRCRSRNGSSRRTTRPAILDPCRLKERRTLLHQNVAYQTMDDQSVRALMP